MPGTCGTRATSGSRHSREMSVWARRAASECDQNAGGLPLVIQPLQPVPEDAVATKSAFIVPQDATRLNQGHCGSPEDNPVFILPASDPAPRGNPILVPLDVSRRGHRRSCIEKGDWVAYPVDLQGKRLLGMAWPELRSSKCSWKRWVWLSSVNPLTRWVLTD